LLQLDRVIWFLGCLILGKQALTLVVNLFPDSVYEGGGEGAISRLCWWIASHPGVRSSSSEHLRDGVIPSPSCVSCMILSSESCCLALTLARFSESSHFAALERHGGRDIELPVQEPWHGSRFKDSAKLEMSRLSCIRHGPLRDDSESLVGRLNLEETDSVENQSW